MICPYCKVHELFCAVGLFMSEWKVCLAEQGTEQVNQNHTQEDENCRHFEKEVKLKIADATTFLKDLQGVAINLESHYESDYTASGLKEEEGREPDHLSQVNRLCVNR